MGINIDDTLTTHIAPEYFLLMQSRLILCAKSCDFIEVAVGNYGIIFITFTRSVNKLKTCIIYYSQHHGNTKKLLDAIKAVDSDVELVDATKRHEVDLSGYDRIGFASGIYYGKFAEQILNFAKVNLPIGKDVFFIATAGNPMKNNFNAIGEITSGKHCNELGRFISKGFDTYGPFKIVGGLQKGHPTDEEIEGAVNFYKGISDGKEKYTGNNR